MLFPLLRLSCQECSATCEQLDRDTFGISTTSRSGVAMASYLPISASMSFRSFSSYATISSSAKDSGARDDVDPHRKSSVESVCFRVLFFTGLGQPGPGFFLGCKTGPWRLPLPLPRDFPLPLPGRRLPTQPNCGCRGEPQCPHPSHATEMHIRQQLCWQLHGLRHPDKDSSGSEDRKRCTLQHRMNVSHVLSLQFVQILPKESCEFLGQWCQILLRNLVFEKRCQTRRHFEARSLPNVTKLAEDGQVQGSSARRLALQDLCHEADGVQHHAHVTNFFKFLICDGQWVILPRCAR